MKKMQYIMGALLLLGSSRVVGQQESLITFYRQQLNLINPAALSVDGGTYVSAMIREQWTGVKEAPQTQAVSFTTPLKKNLHFGVSVVNDRVFIEKQTFVSVDVSYKVQLNSDLDLFMGVKAGGNNYEVNTSGLETYNAIMDPSLQPLSRFNPNVGVGFYLHHADYYVSLSSPKLLDTQRAKNEQGYASAATDRAHYYLSGGRTFGLTQDFDLTPSVLFRYVNGAPFSTDFTTTFSYRQQLSLGATYRTDRSLAGMLLLTLDKQLDLGYAYEYSTRSELLGRVNGSNEFFLRFKFN